MPAPRKINQLQPGDLNKLAPELSRLLVQIQQATSAVVDPLAAQAVLSGSVASLQGARALAGMGLTLSGSLVADSAGADVTVSTSVHRTDGYAFQVQNQALTVQGKLAPQPLFRVDNTGTLDLPTPTVAASAGAPLGYFTMVLSGTAVKVPYYSM